MAESSDSQRSQRAGSNAPRTAFVLLTDIYKSSGLFDIFPNEYKSALNDHNAILESAIEKHSGEIISNPGDSYVVLFDLAEECVGAAFDVGLSLPGIEPFPDDSKLLVRVVCHAGKVSPLGQGRSYLGGAINRASRICQVCHPGQILISEKVNVFLPSLPSGSRLINLGEHRLRDLAKPEHLLQLDHPDFGKHDFPTLATLDFRPNNLLVQPNAFIGRAREQSDLKEMLTGESRLVTITAPGGYGKSRLALQVSANLLDEFENGVFEVLLAPVANHERIVSTTADALGFQFYGQSDPKEQLIDYLREKEMLVLFDNFEHVMAGRSLLPDILSEAPNIRMLVTSREPLRITGEQVFKLQPLAVGNVPSGGGTILSRSTEETPDKIVVAPGLEEIPDAVALFADRAMHVQRDFALLPDTLPIVQSICEKLEGVPLSIELSSAWADTFTLPELLEEVEEVLELAARLEDVPGRHRNVRACLDWSFKLLNDDEVRVLRAISTFKSGFFIEAAGAVLGLEASDGDSGGREAKRELRKKLSRLLDKSWVFTRDVGGKSRFIIRDAASYEYAFEKLTESDDYERAVLLHAKFFAELVEREGERLRGHGQLEAIKLLGLELDNILAALDTALRNSQTEGELLLPFAKYLGRYLEITSRSIEGAPLYEKMIECGKVRELTELLVYSLVGYGRLLFRLGLLDESSEKYKSAQKLAKDLSNRKSLSSIHNGLGLVAWNRGQFDEASALYKKSLGISREIGDRNAIAASLNNLGLIESDQGNYNEAQELYDESLKIRREIGDSRGIALSLNNSGLVSYYQGFSDEARELFYESLITKREIGNNYGIASSLNNLGLVAFSEENYEEARKLHMESLEIRREIRDRYGIASSLTGMGLVALKCDRYREARELFLESMITRREIGDRSGLCSSLIAAGCLFLKFEQFEKTAVAQYGARHQSETLGFKFDPAVQKLLDEGLQGLEEARKSGKITSGELQELESRAKDMSLDDLADFAIAALENLVV